MVDASVKAKEPDAAAKEAWRLVEMLIERTSSYTDEEVLVGGHGFYESCAHHIAAAIRDAEQRGMLRAAEIVRAYTNCEPGGISDGVDIGAMMRDLADLIETRAIERAAEIELLDDAKELGADGEG